MNHACREIQRFGRSRSNSYCVSKSDKAILWICSYCFCRAQSRNINALQEEASALAMPPRESAKQDGEQRSNRAGAQMAPFFTALDSWVNLNLVETPTFPGGVVLTRYETRH